MTMFMQHPILPAGAFTEQWDTVPAPVSDHERLLNRLVDAVGPAFEPVNFVAARHVVTGLFIGPDGEGHQANLFYNRRFQLAGLTLHLHPRGVMSPGQVVCLLRIQGRAQLARLDYEPQDCTLTLHARSIWLIEQSPAPVVRPIIKDIRHVLADDRLRAIAA